MSTTPPWRAAGAGAWRSSATADNIEIEGLRLSPVLLPSGASLKPPPATDCAGPAGAFAFGGVGLAADVAELEVERCEMEPSSGELVAEESDEVELLFRKRFRNAVLPRGCCEPDVAAGCVRPRDRYNEAEPAEPPASGGDVMLSSWRRSDADDNDEVGPWLLIVTVDAFRSIGATIRGDEGGSSDRERPCAFGEMGGRGCIAADGAGPAFVPADTDLRKAFGSEAVVQSHTGSGSAREKRQSES